MLRLPLPSLPVLALLPTLLTGCSGSDGTDDTGGGNGNGGDNGGGGVDAPTVVINEILSANLSTNADELGEFDDWVELYNHGDAAVELGGLYLSDDTAFLTAWAIPAGTLPAGGYMLIWCDDGTGTDSNHATFKLNAAGDEILLSYVEGSNDPVQVDWVQYGAQADDKSAARVPDGSDTWLPGQTPTPGASNGS